MSNMKSIDKKLKIAITGSIGSGKTLVSNYFQEKGYPVLSADLISKELLQNNQQIKAKIIKAFVEQSYTDNILNKKFLAEQVFANETNVEIINSIVHPLVIKQIETESNNLLQSHSIVFTEAALIYEADMEDLFDYVILVTSEEDIRLQRKIQSENYTEEEFFRRNNNQIPDKEKKKRADFILENNKTIKELKNKADFTLKIIEGLLAVND